MVEKGKRSRSRSRYSKYRSIYIVVGNKSSMRVNRIFSIEIELVQKLQKEENMSAIVNSAIQMWYDAPYNKVKNMTDDEKRHRLKEIELEKEFKAKMEALNAK